MRMKSLKYLSIPRGTKLLPQAVIRLAVYGQSIQEMKSKSSEVMKMKYSLVLSTTKVTLSLLVQRITLAVSGRINTHLRELRSLSQLQELQQKEQPIDL
jgi:hypothetical protein